MSHNRIEPPVKWREYTSFTGDLDLRALGPGGPATIIRIVDAGTGSMGLHTEDLESDAGMTQFTALTAAEEIIGHFTKIRRASGKATIFGLSAADIAAAGGLTDGQTLTFKVDGGGEETATFNTGDFVDIATPTLAELKTVIEADTTGEVVATGTLLELNSPTAGSGGTLQLTSTGDAHTVLLGAVTAGNLAVHTGSDTNVAKIRVGWPRH